ncbi:sensor protein FixL [Acrasis kona]|uniref:Sensor protein FixL n=1 Tax=Acrasis kona TaxID=1008807 RepID=A0AAW2ZI95_9EUKA
MAESPQHLAAVNDHSTDSISSKECSSTSSGGKLDRQIKLINKLTPIDGVFAAVAILILVLCLVGGLTGYFVMQTNFKNSARAQFADESQDFQTTINANIKRVTNDLIVLQTAFKLFDDIDYNTRFVPLVSSLASVVKFDNGSFIMPEYCSFLTYIQVVPFSNQSTYLSTIQSWGGPFANVKSIDTASGSGPDIVRPNYYAITLKYPLDDTIGRNSASDPVRNETLTNAYNTHTIQVSNNTLFLGETQLSGVIVFAPVVRGNVTIGFVSAGFYLSKLLQVSFPLDAKNAIVMLDSDNTVMAVTTRDHSLCTKNCDNISYKDVRNYLSNVMYNDSITVELYNKKYKLIYVSNTVYEDNLKIVPLCSCLIVMLAAEIMLVLVYGYRRVIVAKRVQDLTKQRVEVLEAHRSKLASLLKKSVKSESKSRSIINSIPDLVIVIDRSGKIMQTNNSFDNIFSYNEQEWNLGVNISTILVDSSPNFYETTSEDTVIETNITLRDYTTKKAEVKVASINGDEVETTPITPFPMEKSMQIQKQGDEDDEAYVILIRVKH